MSNQSKGVSIKAKTSAQETSLAETKVDLDDHLAVDPRLLSEMKEKGYAHRWINGKKFKENYGFDSRQWQPYKRDTNSKALENNNAYGFTDSEGYFRRGDLILAVRPLAVHDAVKRKIRSKNANLSKAHQKQAAADIQKTFAEHGATAGAKVIEGFEEND